MVYGLGFLGPLGSWVLQGPGYSRFLGPQGFWVLKGPGFSRILGPQGSSRVLGPCFPVCRIPSSFSMLYSTLKFLKWSMQYNHRSLMISVNDAKHIHLLPIFRTFQSFSYCKYKPFINSFQSYLFLLQMLVKLFFSNRIIDILYNLNKYMQC